MENSLTDQKIDPNTIMKQLDEYRRVYRSMVLEMNQIIHKKKKIIIMNVVRRLQNMLMLLYHKQNLHQ